MDTCLCPNSSGMVHQDVAPRRQSEPRCWFCKKTCLRNESQVYQRISSPRLFLPEAPFPQKPLSPTPLCLRPNHRVPGSLQAKDLVSSSRGQQEDKCPALWISPIMLSPIHKMRCNLKKEKKHRKKSYAVSLLSTGAWWYAVWGIFSPSIFVSGV